MRIGRLSQIIGVAALIVGAAIPPVAAQDGGGVNTGNANNTPDGATITAGSYSAGNPQGSSGEGQVNDAGLALDCDWRYQGESGLSEGELGSRLSDAQEQDESVENIPVAYVCRRPNGEPYSVTAAEWPGDVPEVLVDPYDLAIEAQNAITLPVPHIATSPPIEAGSYATLPTYLNIQNWDQGPLTASASAGPVTVTVEANPVQAEWVIHDSVRGTEERITCTGPGSLDGASDGCTWTPEHSSDGQPADNPWMDEGTGEPCFYAEVYFTWSMTWTVDGAPGEPGLDDGVTAGSTCIVVAEVQAVVDDA